ncbi:hypothetical protein WOLCODRAFT_148426 [Wolfiporia cocos MD-104 SS10]|uniref:Uncharacterized protein n=1 Tax=Wolfiporia cocos (strain MD-104) TaxID=742152 RepID=A0A2H3IWN9_WOLCO|nr:hypothetical protein WOLCODRAFT_148426 [Wolfiporia cocos MD-104 SS10]
MLLLLAYPRLAVADNVAQRIKEVQCERGECGQELETARKMAPQRGLRKKRPSLLQILSKENQSVPHLPIQPLPDWATTEIVDAIKSIHELERRYAALTQQVETLELTKAKLDSCYDALKIALDNSPLSFWRSNEDEVIRAEKSVSIREGYYHDCVAVTNTFKRARIAVQSAHHHYKEAMDIMDSVCSPKRSALASIMGDEQSKEQTYREAGQWAQKAQICFDECLRVLQPHVVLLRQEEVEDCEQLKRAGLLQALRLYELMYGGKALNFGITREHGAACCVHLPTD